MKMDANQRYALQELVPSYYHVCSHPDVQPQGLFWPLSEQKSGALVQAQMVPSKPLIKKSFSILVKDHYKSIVPKNQLSRFIVKYSIKQNV